METSSAIRKIQQKPRPSARCRASRPEQAKKRTAGSLANDFLNHRFFPFWQVEHRNYKALEAEFFRSLHHLTTLYNLSHPFLDGLVYPQNIAEAYAHVCDQFKNIDSDLECIIMRDEHHLATLVTTKCFHTGQTLYYIPVNPLWQIINCAQQQPLAELLLSMFAYLYQVADVPYYRDSDSYLQCQYDYIKDWINSPDEDADGEFKKCQNRDLELLETAGDCILSVICQHAVLEQLEARIEAYRKWVHMDERTVGLAKEFLQLYLDYPGQSVFDRVRPDLFESENEDWIHADQYIGFYWSGNDTLNETLFEMINNELQEYANTEQPTTLQIFDCPQSEPLNDLDFERRLFKLMDRLADFLAPYDNDQHQ